MTPLFSIDFRFVRPEEATVSVMDRSFLYGDSVYEVVRTYRTSIAFLIDRHYERLTKSAEAIDIKIPFTLRDLESHVREAIVKANYEDSYIRIIVSRGEDDRFDLSIRQTVKPRTVVVVTKIPQFPTEYFEKGISVEVVSVKRNLRAAIDPNIKSGNYLNNILALREARKKGAVDAVLLNAEGNVTEATTSNVFLVKAGRIVTPDTESGILDGVTRGLLLEALGHHRIPFEVRAVSEKEFLAADEIFGTSTLKEVIPITRLNGRDVGAGRPGPVTLAVRGHLRTRIEEMLNAMERDPASNQTS